MRRRSWDLLLVALLGLVPLAGCARTSPAERREPVRAQVPSSKHEPPRGEAVPLSQVPGPALPAGRLERVSLFFDFDSYVLRSDAGPQLQQVARVAKEAGRPVKIEGHCDERGTPEYNLALGEGRARAAQRYLEALGIPRGNIGVVSFGSQRPRATGHDEASWADNRRGDVFLQ
jgi:peptidoglycan-associated lipoprotein